MDAMIGGLFVLAGVLLQFVLSVAQQAMNRRNQRYRNYFIDASKDIQFLLAVEEKLLERLKESENAPTKTHIRQEVKDQGLEWSGRFTPGRNRDRMKRLKVDYD